MVPERRAAQVTSLVLKCLLSVLFISSGACHASESVKIYRSTMPDGSVMLGDRPAAGARSVNTDIYVLTAPRGAAETEREYWQRQSEAFNLRQQQREVEAPRWPMSPGGAGGAAMRDDHLHAPSHQYVIGYGGAYAITTMSPYASRPATWTSLSYPLRPVTPLGFRGPPPASHPAGQPLGPRHGTQHQALGPPVGSPRSPSASGRVVSGHRAGGISGSVPGPVR